MAAATEKYKPHIPSAVRCRVVTSGHTVARRVAAFVSGGSIEGIKPALPRVKINYLASVSLCLTETPHLILPEQNTRFDN